MPTGPELPLLHSEPEIGREREGRCPSHASAERRLPRWLKRRVPKGNANHFTAHLLDELQLETVCDNARCPNRMECYSQKTATFMILGNICTRACGFCAVPRGRPEPPAADEPQRVAEAAARLGLRHVVITSVTRDDLPDGGAAHFAACVREIKRLNPATAVEALTPDFQGVMADVATVVDSGLDVFAQNVETVRRLTHPVRDPRASYEQTLAVLAHAKRHRREQGDVLVKTSLMLGLGETDAEILETMRDLRAAGVDLLTLGQYLRPTVNHLAVERFVTPEEFERYRQHALELGFVECVSGPLVRSSYRAEQAMARNNAGLAAGGLARRG